MSRMLLVGGKVAGPKLAGLAAGMTSLQSVNCRYTENISAVYSVPCKSLITSRSFWPRKESLRTPAPNASAIFDCSSVLHGR